MRRIVCDHFKTCKKNIVRHRGVIRANFSIHSVWVRFELLLGAFRCAYLNICCRRTKWACEKKKTCENFIPTHTFLRHFFTIHNFSANEKSEWWPSTLSLLSFTSRHFGDEKMLFFTSSSFEWVSIFLSRKNHLKGICLSTSVTSIPQPNIQVNLPPLDPVQELLLKTFGKKARVRLQVREKKNYEWWKISWSLRGRKLSGTDWCREKLCWSLCWNGERTFRMCLKVITFVELVGIERNVRSWFCDFHK